MFANGENFKERQVGSFLYNFCSYIKINITKPSLLNQVPVGDFGMKVLTWKADHFEAVCVISFGLQDKTQAIASDCIVITTFGVRSYSFFFQTEGKGRKKEGTKGKPIDGKTI